MPNTTDEVDESPATEVAQIEPPSEDLQNMDCFNEIKTLGIRLGTIGIVAAGFSFVSLFPEIDLILRNVGFLSVAASLTILLSHQFLSIPGEELAPATELSLLTSAAFVVLLYGMGILWALGAVAVTQGLISGIPSFTRSAAYLFGIAYSAIAFLGSPIFLYLYASREKQET